MGLVQILQSDQGRSSKSTLPIALLEISSFARSFVYNQHYLCSGFTSFSGGAGENKILHPRRPFKPSVR